MSWHCLQEQEEEYSLDSYLAGVALERARLKNTRGKCCLPGSETESYQNFQSGMTFGPLTASHGEDSLTSSREDSRARTFPQQGKALDLPESAADCGGKCTGWFARYDRERCLWRIPHYLPGADLDVFLGTWPRQGMMRAGHAYRQRIAEHRTSETEFGCLLPTPTASEAEKHVYRKTREAIKKASKRERQTITWVLQNAEAEVHPGLVIVDPPNPEYVEFLQGFPIGWTDCGPLAMRKFQLWRLQHTECLRAMLDMKGDKP